MAQEGNRLFRDEVDMFGERVSALRASRANDEQELLLAELQMAQAELRGAYEEIRAQRDELTELVRTHETARLAYERLVAVLPLPVLTTDLHGAIRSANACAAELMGVHKHRLLGKPLLSIVDMAGRQTLRQALAQLAAGTRTTYQTDCTLILRRDGRFRAHLHGSTSEGRRLPRDEVTWVVSRAEPTEAEQESGRRLSRAVVELTQVTLEAEDPSEVLVAVARTCQHAFAAPVAVSVTLGSPEAPTVLATDSQIAQAVDGAQMVAGEGPCVDAWATQDTVTSSALPADPRWPRLGPRVSGGGVQGAVASPLHAGGQVVGALNVYGTDRSFDVDEQTENVELLASAVSAVVKESELRAELENVAGQLKAALESRATIDQAKGMVMAAYGCGPDEAFSLLVRASNSTNIKLKDLAAKLVTDASAGKTLSGLRGSSRPRR